MGTGKPNIGLDFAYNLLVTWYRALAMHILFINLEILGPLDIFGMAKDRNFLCSGHIQHNKYFPSDDNDYH